MIGIQTTTILFFEIIASLLCRQTVESIFQATNLIIVGTVDTFDDGIAGVSLSLPFFAILIDTYHLEGEVTHLYILTQ